MTRQLGGRARPLRSTIGWPGMHSQYARLPPHPDSATSTGPHQVGVSFSAHAGLARESGGRTVRGDIRAGTAFVTDGEPISWLGVAEPTEAMEIYLDPALTDGLGALRVDAAEGVHDGVLFGLVSIVKRAHVTGGRLTDIEASTLAHKLARHLAVGYRGAAVSDEPGEGALSRAVVDRVAQYIRARLAGPITLDELAAQAALSPYHFARAFKASTGLPPHRYVNTARLEAAKTALLRGTASVPEVAYSVGFSNVSHFRRLFRRELGVLPGEVRAGAIAQERTLPDGSASASVGA